MNHLKTFAQLNEAAAKKVTKKQTDYSAKFATKLSEVSAIIAKAKEDDIYAVECDSTYESMYQFKSISIVKNKLCVKYKEVHGEDKTDCVDLKKDEANGFDEAKALFSWVKKCIAKGRSHEKRTAKKEEKENAK